MFQEGNLNATRALDRHLKQIMCLPAKALKLSSWKDKSLRKKKILLALHSKTHILFRCSVHTSFYIYKILEILTFSVYVDWTTVNM